MNLPLLDIERSCGKHVGGLRDLGLIDPADLVSVEPLVFKSGKRIFLFQQNRFTGRLRRKHNDSSKAGDTQDYQLTGFVKGIRGDMDLLAMRFMNRRIHILVTYWGDTQRLLKFTRPLTDHDSGDRLGSRIGYNLEATCRQIGSGTLIGSPIELPTIETGTGDPDPEPGGGPEVIIVEDEADHTFTIPAGKLLTAVYIKGDSNQTVTVGLSSTSGEIMEGVPLLANQWSLSGNNSLYAETPTPIYFSGLTGTNIIKIWLL